MHQRHGQLYLHASGLWRQRTHLWRLVLEKEQEGCFSSPDIQRLARRYDDSTAAHSMHSLVTRFNRLHDVAVLSLQPSAVLRQGG